MDEVTKLQGASAPHEPRSTGRLTPLQLLVMQQDHFCSAIGAAALRQCRAAASADAGGAQG